jgi:flagellar biosynthesis protein FliQ
MTIGWVKAILQRGVIQVLMIASPLLLSALVIGLIVAILQATTSIQEQTLVFVPKVVVILVVLAVLGGWMFTSLGDYTRQLFNMIPSMAR